MVQQSYDEDNKFGRFFYSPVYVSLKNFLFNYRLRKAMVEKYAYWALRSRLLDPRTIIIDIGSGISPISPVEKKTIFIDLEKEAVNYLRRKNLRAEVGNITNLMLKSDSVDVIFCSEVLEHVPDYKKALSEIKRVLKSGGCAIITVPVHQYYWKNDDEFVGHFRRFDPAELAKDIKTVGLKIVVKKPIGNWLERNLSWLAINVAKRNVEKMVDQQSVSKFSTWLFYLVNASLFYFLKASYLFNTLKRSSVVLFVVVK